MRRAGWGARQPAKSTTMITAATSVCQIRRGGRRRDLLSLPSPRRIGSAPKIRPVVDVCWSCPGRLERCAGRVAAFVGPCGHGSRATSADITWGWGHVSREAPLTARARLGQADAACGTAGAAAGASPTARAPEDRQRAPPPPQGLPPSPWAPAPRVSAVRRVPPSAIVEAPAAFVERPPSAPVAHQREDEAADDEPWQPPSSRYDGQPHWDAEGSGRPAFALADRLGDRRRQSCSCPCPPPRAAIS